MTNITQIVNGFLLKNPSIIRDINRGIINTSALANLIIQTEKLRPYPHAVISAIRRFSKKETEEGYKEVENILKKSKISTKSRLVFITLSRDFSFLAKVLPSILNKINPLVGEVLRVVEGRESIKLLIDSSKKDEILSIIDKEFVKEVNENLAEINIHFAEKYQEVRGLRATILNELAINDIDVYEIIGCLPEFMVILEEKDIGKAHDALLSLFYE